MITVKITKDTITKSLTNTTKELAKIPPKAFTFFKAHTPIRTGNARAKTYLQNETIVNAYSYASSLDRGASRQAPDGMSKPTLAFIKKLADAILKRK